jgi:hypothetical protein
MNTLLPADAGSSLPVVRARDIEAVVAAWSGVPVEQLTADEMAKLVRLVRVPRARARARACGRAVSVSACLLGGGGGAGLWPAALKT